MISFFIPTWAYTTYDGNTTFNEYLIYGMNALFSHFTLYKPIFVVYNMICNKHYNSSKKSQKTCLEKDMKTHKYKALKWLKKMSLKKCSIQSFHKYTRYSLMAQNTTIKSFMNVENFGHFFLALIIDESSLCYNKLLILKKLLNVYMYH